MTFEEFRDNTKKVTDRRVSKVTNSIGIRQLFLYALSNKWFGGKPVTELQFQLIVRLINIALGEEISYGRELKFPLNLGSIELRKFLNTARFKDGKLKVSNPIDWDATLKLWYEDKEALENKTLVRTTDRELFLLIYNRARAIYTNKSFFEFNVNRGIKQTLKKHIKLGKVEVFNKSAESLITR